MLEFKEKIILTSIEQKESQKTGRTYKIANFLGENGQTFTTMLDCDVPDGLKQLDWVDVLFKVIPGRYTQLRVKEINKSS